MEHKHNKIIEKNKKEISLLLIGLVIPLIILLCLFLLVEHNIISDFFQNTNLVLG